MNVPWMSTTATLILIALKLLDVSRVYVIKDIPEMALPAQASKYYII